MGKALLVHRRRSVTEWVGTKGIFTRLQGVIVDFDKDEIVVFSKAANYRNSYIFPARR